MCAVVLKITRQRTCQTMHVQGTAALQVPDTLHAMNHARDQTPRIALSRGICQYSLVANQLLQNGSPFWQSGPRCRKRLGLVKSCFQRLCTPSASPPPSQYRNLRLATTSTRRRPAHASSRPDARRSGANLAREVKTTQPIET